MERLRSASECSHDRSRQEAQDLLQNSDAEPSTPTTLSTADPSPAPAWPAARSTHHNTSAPSARALRGRGSPLLHTLANAEPGATVRQRRTPQRRAADPARPRLTACHACWQSLAADDKTSLWPGRRPCWARWPAAGSDGRWGCHQPPLPRPLAGAATLRRFSLSDGSTQ